MTDGEWYTRWSVMDLPRNSNLWHRCMQDYFVGSGLSFPPIYPRIRICLSLHPSRQT
jgi:hypothetical protein